MAMVDTIVVFTAKNIDEIFEQGGVGDWKLSPSRAKNCDYIVSTANSHHPGSNHPIEKHGYAFLVGKISELIPASDRWIIQMSEYALINVPDVWTGNQNPIMYADIINLDIHPEQLNWKPFPVKSTMALNVSCVNDCGCKTTDLKTIGNQPRLHRNHSSRRTRQPSVLGPTKVSGSLIQTSEARDSASLLIWEAVIISLIVGSWTSDTLVFGILTFLILLCLIETRVWIWISYAVSIFVAIPFGQAGFEGHGLVGGIVFFALAYFVMLSWHHWSLAYWRGLVE